MIRCHWLSIACLSSLLLASPPALAQSDNDSTDDTATINQKTINQAAAITDQGDNSLTGILKISNYTFNDLTIYWDNDGTVPDFIDDTDRYYTNANGLELSFNPNLSPALEKRLAISSSKDQRFGVGISLKQRIYTPSSILQTNPTARDHPYAGYFALGLSFQRADEKTHEHFGLDLGTTGPASGAEMIQEWIHSTFPNVDDPVGWDTQLSNEPTINFSYTKTWKSQPTTIQGLELELLPAIGLDAGTVLISTRSSMTLRIGKNLPKDFGPATLLGQKDHTVRISQSSDSPWSLYAFTRLGVDAIARDMFLDGTIFNSSRSTQRVPLVATFTFGLVARHKGLYLGWSQNFQTKRFELQTDSQTWGSVVLGYSFDW